MTTIQVVTHLASQASASQPQAGMAGTARGDLPAQWSPPAGGVSISSPSRLQSERDAAIALGQRAHAVEATFTRMMALVEGMKAQLGGITKQFPPFAADSDDRSRFLSEFSGLRAQIESLTFPPEPTATGEWRTVEFPPPRMDWDIPRLENAGDEAVLRAEKLVNALGEDLARRHQRFRDSIGQLTGAEAMLQARDLSLILRHHLAS